MVNTFCYINRVSLFQAITKCCCNLSKILALTFLLANPWIRPWLSLEYVEGSFDTQWTITIRIEMARCSWIFIIMVKTYCGKLLYASENVSLILPATAMRLWPIFTIQWSVNISLEVNFMIASTLQLWSSLLLRCVQAIKLINTIIVFGH